LLWVLEVLVDKVEMEATEPTPPTEAIHLSQRSAFSAAEEVAKAINQQVMVVAAAVHVLTAQPFHQHVVELAQ
jgi:UDP-glucose 6-dehydrogenase